MCLTSRNNLTYPRVHCVILLSIFSQYVCELSVTHLVQLFCLHRACIVIGHYIYDLIRTPLHYLLLFYYLHLDSLWSSHKYVVGKGAILHLFFIELPILINLFL